MFDKTLPRLSPAERFSPEVLARAAGAARSYGFPQYALGILGRGVWPNIDLFDELTGSHLALNGRSLREVKSRTSWKPKNLTAYVLAVQAETDFNCPMISGAD